MQREMVIKSKGLGGTSDLTLLAPLKSGFVDSLESVTYKTRTKRVLETLHRARVSAHEYARARLLSDAVERVEAIHSVRVAIVEPENMVLLAVTFDGSWESYLRVLWDKVGTLLDLIFCGTTGYVTSWDHSYEEWAQWARSVQIETGFFYGPPETSARDMLYERRIADMRARRPAADLNEAELNELRAVLPTPEAAVRELISPPSPATRPADWPPVLQCSPEQLIKERFQSGLQGLAGLYRLAELHRPGTADGDTLRRAAIDLLREFLTFTNAGGGSLDRMYADADKRFSRQLNWLIPERAVPVENVRPRPEAAAQPAPQPDPDIQGGILRTYEGVTNGALLLLRFADFAIAQKLLAWIDPLLTRDDQGHIAEKDKVFVNVAFTAAGLRAIGVDESALELFPEDFRQGMAARSGLLGDVRNNHPRRWRPPGRFAHLDCPAAGPAIEIDAVHAIVQMRCLAEGRAAAAFEISDPHYPLRGRIEDLIHLLGDDSLLAVQPLVRRFEQRLGQEATVDHFGYADGNGQPEIEPTDHVRNRIMVGEIVCGHDNGDEFAVDPSDPSVAQRDRERSRWLRNGSFLVVRKYRQFTERLDEAVRKTAEAMAREVDDDSVGEAPEATASEPGLDGVDREQLVRQNIELVYAKLMGRWRDGAAIVGRPPRDAGELNRFDYDNDPQGKVCPLHAHVRRAHPRLPPYKAPRPPRLMRRGMSYGPPAGSGDRGLVFMAYNASLGEQFEVVQRWLVGGNSTGSSSLPSCPIVGVPQAGLQRSFAFEHEGQVFRVDLDAERGLFDEPMAPTRLEWGMYLFAPGLAVLHRLHAVAAAAVSQRPVPWDVDRGRKLIAEARRVEREQGAEAAVLHWKALIEDPESIERLDGASMWAALRADHASLLRTPYGVLVADRALIAEVLDPGKPYSVSGQLDRMKRSFGEISLGLDAGPLYEQQSRTINEEIGRITREETFGLAITAARTKIDDIVEEAKKQSRDVSDAHFEVGFEARELLDEVLGALSDAWFGLGDDPGKRFARGGADWAWRRGDPPRYPGHFTAMSRYMFQPHPGETVAELGEHYGQAWRESMRLFVGDHRARGTKPQWPGGGDARLAAAAFDHPSSGSDDDFVARMMVGVLMGFSPTIIGAVLNVLHEWHRDASFGALRARLAGSGDFESADAVVSDAMQSAARVRPMPQIAWRTALKPQRLGGAGPEGVDVKVGDRVVLALVSATQQSLADGCPDGRAMFGGIRRHDNGHPTHACPGYEAAIGAMLGALTALLERAEEIRPGVAAATFVIRGESRDRPEAAEEAAAAGGQAGSVDTGVETISELALGSNCAVSHGTGVSARPAPGFGGAPPAIEAAMATLRLDLEGSFEAVVVAPSHGTPMSAPMALDLARPSRIDYVTEYRFTLGAAMAKREPTLVVWGDSWVNLVVDDLADELERLRTMRVDREFCQRVGDWLTIENMARNAADFATSLGNDVDAILLSGGGNDSTAKYLGDLLLPRGSATTIDPLKLQAHIAKLEGHYKTIVGKIRGVANTPIFVHGYDYPIPQGKSYWPAGLVKGADYASDWMLEPFHDKQYEWPRDETAMKGAMRELIDALNAMLSTLADVHYVKLTGTIEGNWPGHESDHWRDDLHAEPDALAKMAEKLASEINRVLASAREPALS